LTLDLTDPHENNFFRGWGWNLQPAKQHVNYLRHWCRYDIDVVQRVVYLPLERYDCRSASIWAL